MGVFEGGRGSVWFICVNSDEFREDELDDLR